MSEKKALRLKKPTRASELDAWFVRHRLTKTGVGQMLGISGQRVGQLLRGIYLTPEWRSRLIAEVGIPARLLPHAREYE